MRCFVYFGVCFALWIIEQQWRKYKLERIWDTPQFANTRRHIPASCSVFRSEMCGTPFHRHTFSIYSDRDIDHIKQFQSDLGSISLAGNTYSWQIVLGPCQLYSILTNQQRTIASFPKDIFGFFSKALRYLRETDIAAQRMFICGE